jgi:L-alanine-DL-glutamate epimerase-like enolase superfamily enzyme
VGAARALLADDAVDVLVVKPARVGGPAAVTEIAERAAERGVPVVISTLFETGVGLAAGLLEHDLLAESLIVADGRMHAPARAGSGGLGIVLDPVAVERFRAEAVGSVG